MDIGEEVDNDAGENNVAAVVNENAGGPLPAPASGGAQPTESDGRRVRLVAFIDSEDEDNDGLQLHAARAMGIDEAEIYISDATTSDYEIESNEDSSETSALNVDIAELVENGSHADSEHVSGSPILLGPDVIEPEIQFDTNLPAEHSYLGADMHRVSGVEYLETGRVHKLMMFLHQHIVYPGEVIPFMVHNVITDEDIDTTHGLLFGVAFPHVRCTKTDAMYGVTCQIYEKGNDGRGHTLIKSRALQRFITTNDTKRELFEYITAGPQLQTYGYVKILPEIHLPEPLSQINLGSMNRFRGIPQMKEHLRDFQATTTVWPKYIYNQYDINTVIQKVLISLEANKVESMPSDPVKLSFWLSRNAHLSEEQLKTIFTTDSVNIRMRYIADCFEDGGHFVCRFCRNRIALCSDLFAMSKHGVQSQYCNSAGYIHETNTVYKVINHSVVFSGEPSSEFSWFPGYEWRIITCRLCNRHIGWQFRASVPNLVPQLFYGIAGANVRIDKENKQRTLRDHLLNNLIRFDL